MMKRDTVVPFLKKIQKYMNLMTLSLIPADIRISLLGINNFC